MPPEIDGRQVLWVEPSPWMSDDDPHVRAWSEGRALVRVEGGGAYHGIALGRRAVVWERTANVFRSIPIVSARDPAIERAPGVGAWSVAVPGVSGGDDVRAALDGSRAWIELRGAIPRHAAVELAPAQLRALCRVVLAWPGMA